MDTDLVAQEETTTKDLSGVNRKDHFTGTVVKTSLAGAVVDVGLEVPGVVHISQLQKEPVNRVEDVVKPGQEVEVWVRRVVPKKGRLELTMIKPLDLEWREIEPEMVLKGKVTHLEKFGAFVDIGAERPGLVHISEMTHDYIKNPTEVVKEGDEVEVKVLSVNRQKRQIKLSMKALEEKPVKEVKEPHPREQHPKELHPKDQREHRDRREKDKAMTSPENPVAEVEKEEAVPTAMEAAMREAMERSRDRDDQTVSKDKRKPSTQRSEMEKILSRTLEHRVRSK